MSSLTVSTTLVCFGKRGRWHFHLIRTPPSVPLLHRAVGALSKRPVKPMWVRDMNWREACPERWYGGGLDHPRECRVLGPVRKDRCLWTFPLLPRTPRLRWRISVGAAVDGDSGSTKYMATALLEDGSDPFTQALLSDRIVSLSTRTNQLRLLRHSGQHSPRLDTALGLPTTRYDSVVFT